MVKNKFSIIIPAARDKCSQNLHHLKRAINSVLIQTYPHFELIIVNDGWEDHSFINELPKDNRIKYVHHKFRMNRAYARNSGMKIATGDWFCWLDADDSYINSYLEIANQYINEYPEYKIFNWGSIVITRKGNRDEDIFNIMKFREPFYFTDHQKFKSGKIATGSFIYHKDMYKEFGGLPESYDCYRFADGAKKELPEIREWYGKDYLEGGKELGNPWGDDWYFFYRMTRKHKCKTLELYMYIQYGKP